MTGEEYGGNGGVTPGDGEPVVPGQDEPGNSGDSAWSFLRAGGAMGALIR
jgi:hypothetical protein